MIDPIHPLEKWRRRKGLTQAQLAELAGCSVEVIHKAESRKPIRGKYVDRFLALAGRGSLKRTDFETIAPQGLKNDGHQSKREVTRSIKVSAAQIARAKAEGAKQRKRLELRGAGAGRRRG